MGDSNHIEHGGKLKTVPNDRSKKRRPKMFLGACGITMTVALVLGLRAMPTSPALTHDSAFFLSAAQNLASQVRFSADIGGTLAAEPMASMCSYMPGYPLLLTSLLKLGLTPDLALYVMTMFLWVLLVGLVFTLAWYTTGSIWGALTAAVLVLTFPPVLNEMTYARTESLYIPLSVAVFLVLAMYVRDRGDHRIAYLISLCLLIALTPLVRIVGVLLVPTIGITVLGRSLKDRRFRRLFSETFLLSLTLIPIGLHLISNSLAYGSPYCVLGPKPFAWELGSPRWLATQLLRDFAPQLQMGLGFRHLADLLAGTWPALAALALILLALTIAVIRHYRSEWRSATGDLATWTNFSIGFYVLAYLISFFALSSSTWVEDLPRWLVPLYPLIFLSAVTIGCAIWKNLRSITIRAALVLLLFVYLAGNIQSSTEFLTGAREGRGIETQEYSQHPALAYLRQELRPEDFLFSTKAPTLWYYLQRPVRRLDGIQQLRCEQLPAPERGERSVFVIFPFYVYDGVPTAPSEIAWFRAWASKCGTVVDSRIFSDTTVYVLEY